jgi:hypothetical protein
MTFEDVANSTVQQTLDQCRKTAEETGQVLKESYNAAQQYAEDKGLNLDLGEFVRKEPWLAVTVAFALATSPQRSSGVFPEGGRSDDDRQAESRVRGS